MKKLALALVASAAFAGQAMAADMAVKARPAPLPPPIPVANWTGCYISGGVGYGMSQSENYSYDATVLPRVLITDQWDTGGRGWLGRVGGGCDYQFGGIGPWQVVIGVFGDYDFADIGGRWIDPNPFFGGGLAGQTTLTDQWAIGGRIGVLVTPQLLTYFSGGYTEAKFDGTGLSTGFAPPVVLPGFALNGQTTSGWFIGTGLEYMLNWAPGLTVKTEYRFSEFDVVRNPYFVLGTPLGLEYDSKRYVQTVTTSLSWKFNFGKSPIPVAAKY